MSVRLNRRRSSSLNSNSLLSTLKRRGSITSNELEQMHSLLQKRRQLTTPFIFIILSNSPVFIFTYQMMLIHKGPVAEALNKELSFSEFWNQLYMTLINPIPWLVAILIVQFQLLFLWYLPAKDEQAVTNSGTQFYARHNCFESCVLIVLLYIFGGAVGLYTSDVIFVNWIGIMIVLSIFACLLQTFLFIGQPQESNTENSFAAEVFFGRHLQPIVFGVDVKNFITNRVMLSLWSLYIVSALYSQKKAYGRLTVSLMTCSFLQLIYIARRQWFEHVTDGLDNINDRMGFYRIWGVLVFLPTLYLTPITVLSQTNKSAPSLLCCATSAACLFFQYLNTNIDLQKFNFRSAGGRMKIEGKDPYYINAKFRRENGDVAVELLLGSGYWGKARHLNYTTEFLTYTTWSLTCMLVSAVGFLPALFVGVLLYTRMKCDETRCLLKYTHHWLQYISKVTYLLVPFIY